MADVPKGGFYVLEKWEWRGSEYRRGIDNATCKYEFGSITELKPETILSDTSEGWPKESERAAA